MDLASTTRYSLDPRAGHVVLPLAVIQCTVGDFNFLGPILGAAWASEVLKTPMHVILRRESPRLARKSAARGDLPKPQPRANLG